MSLMKRELEEVPTTPNRIPSSFSMMAFPRICCGLETSLNIGSYSSSKRQLLSMLNTTSAGNLQKSWALRTAVTATAQDCSVHQINGLLKVLVLGTCSLNPRVCIAASCLAQHWRWLHSQMGVGCRKC